MPSIETPPRAGCAAGSARRRGGSAPPTKLFRGTIVPFGRRRGLKAALLAQVAAVGGLDALARAEEVEAAHLEAAADLPDAVEHGPVPLVVGRERRSPPRSRGTGNGHLASGR